MPPVPGGPICATPLPNGNGNCCGPIGAHGPVGQEVYLRIGPSFPIGESNFPRNLNTGIATQIGGRSQFFNAAGDAAWAIDAHLAYTYNNAGGREAKAVEPWPDIPVDVPFLEERPLAEWRHLVDVNLTSVFLVVGPWCP